MTAENVENRRILKGTLGKRFNPGTQVAVQPIKRTGCRAGNGETTMNDSKSNLMNRVENPLETSPETAIENGANRSEQSPAVTGQTKQRTKSLAAFFGAIKFRVPSSTQAQIDRGFARLKSRTQSITEFGDDDGWVRSAN